MGPEQGTEIQIGSRISIMLAEGKILAVLCFLREYHC